MKTVRLAACGVDCAECAQYKVVTNQDVQAAELLVEWFRERGWIGQDEGAEAVIKKAPLCKGCWDITEDCFWRCGCGKRDFRVCRSEKQVRYCEECDEFPCTDYQTWMRWHMGHVKAKNSLLSLRANQ